MTSSSSIKEGKFVLCDRDSRPDCVGVRMHGTEIRGKEWRMYYGHFVWRIKCQKGIIKLSFFNAVTNLLCLVLKWFLFNNTFRLTIKSMYPFFTGTSFKKNAMWQLANCCILAFKSLLCIIWNCHGGGMEMQKFLRSTKTHLSLAPSMPVEYKYIFASILQMKKRKSVQMQTLIRDSFF